MPDNVSPGQLLSRAEVELGKIRSSDQVRLEILDCSVWNNIKFIEEKLQHMHNVLLQLPICSIVITSNKQNRICFFCF